MGNLVKKLLTKEDLQAIASAIGDAEKSTSGEIRVCIRQKRKWGERKLSLEMLTRKEFEQLGMAKTKAHTGVLIFLLLQDKAFHIFADAGIHAKVAEGTWDAIAKDMSAHFTQKNFRQGILHGIKEVGNVLSSFFPKSADDTNELSNDVVVN